MNSHTHWQRWKNIQKAYPFEEKRLLKWRPPFIVQPKYDGVRCRAVRMENGHYMLLSSEENVIFSVPHINDSLDKLDVDWELDGELYCHYLTFEEIISITSRTVNLHPDRNKISYHIFDVVNPKPQAARIKKVVDIQGYNLPHLMPVPFWVCADLDEIMRVYNILVADGYEGIIVRHLEAPYLRKRSIWMMKFKPKQSDTYEIVGYCEEFSKDGIPKGRLGSLQCKSGDGDSFNVGTGFTDEKREQLWEMRGILPGMYAKVEYQHITSGKKVPRFPVFVEVQIDSE